MEIERFETIYAIKNLKLNEVVYVGRTKFLKGRIREHLSKGRKGLTI